MSKEGFRVLAEVRGVGLFDHISVQEFKALVPGQPLLLSPEPENAVDPSAVRVETLTGVPVGYVQREISGKLVAMIKNGDLLLARVFAPPVRKLRRVGHKRRWRWPVAVIWRDGLVETDTGTSADRIPELATI